MRSDGALDNVGIDFDPPIAQESFESGLPGEGVADRLGEFGFPGQARQFVSHKSNSLATTAADLWAFTRVAGFLPRMSSSTFQSAAIVVIVCVANLLERGVVDVGEGAVSLVASRCLLSSSPCAASTKGSRIPRQYVLTSRYNSQEISRDDALAS